MRRMAAALLLACFAPVALGASAVRPSRAADVDQGVRDAFLFAFPVYQIAKTRANAIVTAAAQGRTAVNRFAHRARLATAADRAVTTPNNDTLISSAWLDLSQGPVLLTIPELPDRYHSVALMDVFTDNFAILGTSSNSGMGGRYLITGPSWQGAVPIGTTRIAAPTNIVWTLARILVEGTSDLPAATAAQARFTLLGPDVQRATPVSRLPEHPEPAQLLAAVNDLLTQSGVPEEHRRMAARLTRFGIGPTSSWAGLSSQVRDSWLRQMPVLLSDLRQRFNRARPPRNGWSVPAKTIGNFGRDYDYRAAVALSGLAALPRSEATYMWTDVAAGQCATLVIPSVPLRHLGFWSLTAYELMPDGRQFFVANDRGRYSLGDRTSALMRRADGSVAITLASEDPHSPGTNWLPIATDKAWSVTFRVYRPGREVLNRKWSLPALDIRSC